MGVAVKVIPVIADTASRYNDGTVGIHRIFLVGVFQSDPSMCWLWSKFGECCCWLNGVYGLAVIVVKENT